MILASHNSWSYLKPKNWWMIPLRFTARCQDVDIKTQYEKYGVRCFDLRIQFKNDEPIVVHNIMQYDIDSDGLFKDLEWLNNKRDVYIRLLLDIRNKKKYTSSQKEQFIDFCFDVEKQFPQIRFWNGRGMYDNEVLYNFKHQPSCEEKYSSVCSPKLVDDWYPRFFAWRNNKKMLENGTNSEFLMIDFVNYNK